MATIINTKNLKTILDEIMDSKVSLDSIKDLKDIINYDDKVTFDNVDYLLANIDNSTDGIYCKDIINKIKIFLDNSNKDNILYSSIKTNSKISQMLSVQISGIDINIAAIKITKKKGEKIPELNTLKYNSYIYYDDKKNKIVQVNCV